MKTLLLLFIPFNLYAFTFNNSGEAYFEEEPIKIYVANYTCDGSTSPQDLNFYIDVAINEYWNKVPTSRLKIELGGIVDVNKAYNTDVLCLNNTNCTPNTALKVDDGIVVSCNNSTTNFSTTSILGKTIPNNTAGNKILGALVLINGTSNNQFDSLTVDEKVAVMAHEIGHAIGLGHSPVQDSLMYYLSIPSRRSLGRDDISAVTYLYPALQPFDGGCGYMEEVSGNGPGPGGYFLTTLLAIFLFLGIRKRPLLPRT